MCHQAGDAGDMFLCNPGHILRPVLPIDAPAALVHNLRHDGAGELINGDIQCLLVARTVLPVVAVPDPATAFADPSSFFVSGRQCFNFCGNGLELGLVQPPPGINDGDAVAHVLPQATLVDDGI